MDKELEKIVKQLKADKDFADLSDSELLEMAKMELGSKSISNYVQSAEKSDEKPKKPRVFVASDEKMELFSEIFSNLADVYGGNVEILKENKLISVKIAQKIFKIDIIEQRPPKK